MFGDDFPALRGDNFIGDSTLNGDWQSLNDVVTSFERDTELLESKKDIDEFVEVVDFEVKSSPVKQINDDDGASKGSSS